MKRSHQTQSRSFPLRENASRLYSALREGIDWTPESKLLVIEIIPKDGAQRDGARSSIKNPLNSNQLPALYESTYTGSASHRASRRGPKLYLFLATEDIADDGVCGVDRSCAGDRVIDGPFGAETFLGVSVVDSVRASEELPAMLSALYGDSVIVLRGLEDFLEVSVILFFRRSIHVENSRRRGSDGQPASNSFSTIHTAVEVSPTNFVFIWKTSQLSFVGCVGA